MADIFGSSNQVPAWLQEIARPADGAKLGHFIGTGLAEIATALSRDPNAPEDASWLDSRKGLNEAVAEVRANQTDQFWKLKTAQMQNNIASQQAMTTSHLAQANDKYRETSAWEQDVPKLSSWATATPEARATLPTPGVTSKTALGIVQKTKTADDQYLVRKQAADNQSAAAKQKVQDNADLIKRFNSLDDAVTREQIRQIKDPAQRLQALALAESAQRRHSQNKIDEARLEAEKRGEVPTTTITSKGVTEIYKPTSSSAGVAPKETTLSDGSRLVFNPKSGHFQMERPAESKKMTPAQLQQIADGMDKKDPNRGLILRSLASNAVAQVTATAATKPKEAAAGSGATTTTAQAPSTNSTAKAPVKIQTQADVDEVIRQANEAIKAGKDPTVIRQRLLDMGIKLKE